MASVDSTSLQVFVYSLLVVLMVASRLDFSKCRYVPVCAGALTTLSAGYNGFGLVCTSAGFLIFSHFDTASLLAVHIATGAVEAIYLGSTELIWPLGLALNDSQRVVYVACMLGHQIKTVALPDRYFIDT